jgi:hypothetical protein
VISDQDEVAAFSQQIEELVWEKDITYMEAVVMYCEQTGFEIELASKLISATLKTKIRLEAEGLHYLPRSNTAKLPIM